MPKRPLCISAQRPVSIPAIEPLENRQLFAITIPIITLPITPPGPVPTPISPVGPVSSSLTLLGKSIHAEAGQAFKAVIGTITTRARIPASYSLRGSVDWGDGTAVSAATFVRQSDGTMAVIGSHTYAADGNDAIKITITATPPPPSLAPVIIVGQINSAAQVITSPGGVTLEQTANVPFTADVGSFSSSLTGLHFTAVINWGDGTTSVGKLIAEPVAFGQGGAYQVVGAHTYAQTQSYLVTVTVTAAPIPLPGGPTPQFIILVADIDSVVDVLPVSPIATTM